MKYRIKPKRDFGPGKGFWMKGAGTHGTDNYGFVNRGFVVTYDEGRFSGCNCMPAATWFQTIPEAIYAIRILELVNGKADQFWEYMRGKNELPA